MRHEDLLSYAEVAEVVAAGVAWGIRKVRLTGGEPLVRRDVVDLMAELGRLPGLEQLVLTTNGDQFGRYAERIKRAGVGAVNFSLDSLRPVRFERITRGGDLGRALEGIEAALAVGFETVKANVVVIGGTNDDELLDFVRFALERPVTVRFIELMPLVAQPPLRADAFVPAARMRQQIGRRHRLEPQERGPHAGPARQFAVDGGAGRIGFISPVSDPFCQGCNRLRLTSQGELRGCLADGAAVPLRPLLRGPHARGALFEAFDRAASMKATCGTGCYEATCMSRVGG